MDPFDPSRPSWSSRADGPTCRGDSISSATSSPLPRRLLPCAAAPPSSCASPTAAWCATTAAEEARGAPGCCVLESPGSGRVATPQIAGTGCAGHPRPRLGLHAPPRRSSAVVDGPRHRGDSTPSRCPLLLAADRSRSVSASTLPLTIVDLLLGRFDLSTGPASRAGGCAAFGRDGLGIDWQLRIWLV